MEKDQMRKSDPVEGSREVIDRDLAAKPVAPKLIYEVVEHDDGWAYRVEGSFSETFPSKELAQAAAQRAASEQTLSGETTDILFEDAEGVWRRENSSGQDRPETEVEAPE